MLLFVSMLMHPIMGRSRFQYVFIIADLVYPLQSGGVILFEPSLVHQILHEA